MVFMPIQTREDRFANLAALGVTESVVGTIEHAELLTGISIGAGIGILIDRIEFIFSVTTLAAINAVGDYIKAGWFTSKEASDFNFSDRRLISMVSLHPEPVTGTPASANSIFVQPLFVAFSPPLIIASPRLYLGVLGGNLGVNASVVSRMYFRYQPLTDKEYLELAETFVLVG